MKARPTSRRSSWPASWKRSNQPDRADGEGTLRPAAAPEPALQLPTFPAHQQPPLNRIHGRGKAGVRLQAFQVLDPITPAQIECDHRDDHLHIQPALPPRHPHLAPHRSRQSRCLNQIKVNTNPGKTRQIAAARFAFVLERKNALCPDIFTPLVMELIAKSIMNPSGFKANGEFQLF